jgi:hypothetical protein
MGQSAIKNPRRVVSQPGSGGGGTVDGSGTANEITYWVDSNTIGALAVATYPNLTQLSYVKGVTSAIQTQLNTKSPYPVAEWYSDNSANSPGDGGVIYSGRLNNNPYETVSTYRPVSPKTNAFWLVQVNGLITTALGSSEGITIELLNITQSTLEVLTTGFTLDKRVSSSGYLSSTLASTIGDEMQIRVTFPTWATNPTNVQIQFFLKAY